MIEGMKQTILLVEDDAGLAQLYECELEAEGYRVLHARNGRQGIDMASEECPDLVVLDINMPGVNGLQALQMMLAERPALPVVINSAYGCYQESFASWSASAYVVKSSDLEPLKATVREVLDIAAENATASAAN